MFTDALIQWLIAGTQAALAYISVHVALRPPKLENHKYWIPAIVIVLVAGLSLTGWSGKRNADSQQADRAQIKTLSDQLDARSQETHNTIVTTSRETNDNITKKFGETQESIKAFEQKKSVEQDQAKSNDNAVGKLTAQVLLRAEALDVSGDLANYAYIKGIERDQLTDPDKEGKQKEFDNQTWLEYKYVFLGRIGTLMQKFDKQGGAYIANGCNAVAPALKLIPCSKAIQTLANELP
jgi:hypothetical protein